MQEIADTVGGSIANKIQDSSQMLCHLAPGESIARCGRATILDSLFSRRLQRSEPRCQLSWEREPPRVTRIRILEPLLSQTSTVQEQENTQKKDQTTTDPITNKHDQRRATHGMCRNLARPHERHEGVFGGHSSRIQNQQQVC